MLQNCVQIIMDKYFANFYIIAGNNVTPNVSRFSNVLQIV